MAGHHPAPAPELDHDTIGTTSLASTPRSDHHNNHDDLQPRVRFMCSFGGKILPRPHDNQLRYVGGDTRIVAVNRHTSFASLLAKLAKLSGTAEISIKYQLPNEDLDALITVTGDEDVDNMMEEYDRAAVGHKSARLRLFLFPIEDSDAARASNITSLLDGSSKRENWFLDALNRGSATSTALERGRSEVSSIVSEVPDYLFGLDNLEESSKESNHNRIKSRNDDVSASDPGSPAPVIYPLFSSSTSSSLAPPVKTRPGNPAPPESETTIEKPLSQPTPYSGGPMYHYQSQAVQPIPAVYYLPSGAPPVQPLPVQTQFVQPFPVVPGQVPVGYPGPVYGTGVRPQSELSIGYYGPRNMAMVPGSYTSMVVPGPGGGGGEEIQISMIPGSDLAPGRIP